MNYSTTDAVLFVIISACVMPWTSLAWNLFLRCIRKGAKWSFAYLTAALVVAILQKFQAYASLKQAGDEVMNGHAHAAARVVAGWVVNALGLRDASTTTSEL